MYLMQGQVLPTFGKMFQLNLPSFDFKMRKAKAYTEIFDEVRKSYVKLDPEEWVRQHWLKTLIEHYACPKGRIAVEKSLTYNKTTRRTDVVIYDDKADPLLILELKAPNVKITEKAMEQIGIYNSQLKVPWLLVSNGIKHYVFHCDFQQQKTHLVEDLPSYEEMKQT